MIPRAEIEFTKAMAEKGLRSETPPEVMAELCRVYLAWVDAPEATADGDLPALGITSGKRVKIVEVPDE